MDNAMSQQSYTRLKRYKVDARKNLNVMRLQVIHQFDERGSDFLSFQFNFQDFNAQNDDIYCDLAVVLKL